MNRVLSVEQSQNCSGQSEFVTKRLCISIVFSIGFLCVLTGYILGQLSADSRNHERNHAPFSDLQLKAMTLLKRVEQLPEADKAAKMGVVGYFRCRPFPSAVVGGLAQFLRDVLKFKEDELVEAVELTEEYLDTVTR